MLGFSSVQHSIIPGLIPCSVLPSCAAPHLPPHTCQKMLAEVGDMPRCTHGMGLGHAAPLPFLLENACLLCADCFYPNPIS